MHSPKAERPSIWSELGTWIVTETENKFWNVDFKALIPVILFLIAQMIIGATWIGSISQRLAIREAADEPVVKRLERLELDRDAIIRVQEQLRTLSLSIDKIDRKLDRQP